MCGEDICNFRKYGIYPTITLKFDPTKYCCRMQIGLSRKKAISEVLEIYKQDKKKEIHEVLNKFPLHMIKKATKTVSGISTGFSDPMKKHQLWVINPVLNNELLEAIKRREKFEKYVTEQTKNDPAYKQAEKIINQIYDNYKNAADREYASINSKHWNNFEDFAKKKGFSNGSDYYRWLKSFYFRKGIECPPEELNKIVTGVRFLGKRVSGGVTPKMRDILRNAEKKLKRISREITDKSGSKVDLIADLSNAISRVGGFVPRPLNNHKNLSPHALGRAIDVDFPTNPHIKGKNAERVDKFLEWHENTFMDTNILTTKWRIGKTLLDKKMKNLTDEDVEDMYMNMVEISDVIKSYLTDNLDSYDEIIKKGKESRKKLRKLKRKKEPSQDEIELVKELEKEVDEAKYLKLLVMGLGGKRKAKIRKEVGIITLPLYLYIAMKADTGLNEEREDTDETEEGATSGIEFESSKDSMHFNVPYVKRKVPHCLIKYKIVKNKYARI